jgi:hypothetical protein
VEGSVVGAVFGLLAVFPLRATAQVFTPEDKQVMLQAHNQVRCAVNPTAKVMPALTWNVLLEATAQTWANLCIDTDRNGLIDHNPNRSVGHPYYVGENIYAAGGLPSAVAQPTWAVQSWANEKAYYDLATDTCAPFRVCGHYTQLVWANTLEVGCARALCPLLNYHSVIVSNYGPGAITAESVPTSQDPDRMRRAGPT